MNILADSNFIIDLIEETNWHANALIKFSELKKAGNNLVINQIIYAEVSVAYNSPEELDIKLKDYSIKIDSLPKEAGFIAGKCFLKYKGLGGVKTSSMPDFYIGAHALYLNMPLLTRDGKIYEFYFPKLKIILA